MQLNGEVAIVGIGQSECGRYLPTSQPGFGAKALRPAPNEMLRVGLPVEVVFDDVALEATLTRFRLR